MLRGKCRKLNERRMAMEKRMTSLTAVLLAAMLLGGCSDDGVSVQDGGESALQDTAAAASAETVENDGFMVPVHDLDPEAMLHGDDGMPYFYAPECETVSFYPSEDAVKRCGRFIEYKDVYYLSYTCSAVNFVMTGDRIEAVMVSNGNVYADNQQGWVGVMIDGELTKRIKLDAGENNYVLYEGDMLKNAEISIIKLSENQMATTGVKSITVNAERIAPKYENELRIEFVGDSITCGYGNEADGPEDGYDSAQQNGTATYGYYTAQAMDAEWSMVSISGIGLISDYTSTEGVKEDYLLMPEVYAYNDTNFQMRRGIEEMTEWDFDGGNDIVVINLGTNDYSYTGKNEDLQQEFFYAYYKFIGQVREHNPDAKIICTMGIMGSQLYEEIEKAVKLYCEDTGDTQVYAFEFDYQAEEDGYGGDYHPSAATHKKAAEKLTEYLKALM